MSFSENPYKAMTVIGVGAETGEFKIPYKWECGSCGGESKVEFMFDTPVYEIRMNFAEHLIRSHNLTLDDVKNWSW